MADKLSEIHKVLDAENKLLERFDQKAISLLSILGVFMVFFVVYVRVLPVNPFTVTLVTFYILCALGSILSLIMTIRPRVRSEKHPVESTPPLSEPAFFMGITKFPNASEYAKALDEFVSSNENMVGVYTRQIYSIAQINTTKNKNLQRGMLLVVMALATELVLICYLFINYMGSGAIPPIF